MLVMRQADASFPSKASSRFSLKLGEQVLRTSRQEKATDQRLSLESEGAVSHEAALCAEGVYQTG